MGFLIGLWAVVMVLNCLVLMFLVLIQLPKKEAGAGLAFGGSATDALFGAGTGNVLPKTRKYATGVFFALTIILAVMQRNFHNKSATDLERLMGQQTQRQPSVLPPPIRPTKPTPPSTTTPLTNIQLESTQGSSNTAAPADPAPQR